MAEKTKLETKPERKESFWTAEEKRNLKTNYGTEIIIDNGSLEDVSTRQAPTDCYIVKYVRDDQVYYDLSRGSKVTLFDMYWDKFKGGLKSIAYGNGTIKPNLWGYQAPASKKKKRKV
tara:strand:+ start:572 stop:925 length:354 start_codon:yes stop_codon:yes gene_type:complete